MSHGQNESGDNGLSNLENRYEQLIDFLNQLREIAGLPSLSDDAVERVRATIQGKDYDDVGKNFDGWHESVCEILSEIESDDITDDIVLAIALSTLVNSHFAKDNQSLVPHINFVSKLCEEYENSNAKAVFEQAVQSLDEKGLKTLAFVLFRFVPEEKTNKVLDIDATLPGAALLFQEFARIANSELYVSHAENLSSREKIISLEGEKERLTRENAALAKENEALSGRLQSALNGQNFSNQQSFHAGSLRSL